MPEKKQQYKNLKKLGATTLLPVLRKRPSGSELLSNIDIGGLSLFQSQVTNQNYLFQDTLRWYQVFASPGFYTVKAPCGHKKSNRR